MSVNPNPMPVKPASLDDVLKFCNKVRLAGGGETLSQLLPGYRQVADSCLIARNLNFNCMVSPSIYNANRWSMIIYGDEDLANKIGTAVDCEVTHSFGQSCVTLPLEIARVAIDFDGGRYPQLERKYDDGTE